MPLRLSSRLDDILTGWISIDLYTEDGKARNYYITIASNSIRNTDRRGAPPVWHRVHSAILKPESLDLGADRMTKERRLGMANRTPQYLRIIGNGRISYP